MLKIKKNKFKGLLFFDKELHKDQRGYLRELLIEKEIKELQEKAEADSVMVCLSSH